jgi:hypothetical protein
MFGVQATPPSDLGFNPFDVGDPPPARGRGV